MLYIALRQICFIWKRAFLDYLNQTRMQGNKMRYCKSRQKNFVIKFLEGLFVGPLIPLFWTFGDVCPRFQSQGGFPCLHGLSAACNRFLKFTSSVTPANFLAEELFCFYFLPKKLQINSSWCEWTNTWNFLIHRENTVSRARNFHKHLCRRKYV